MALLFILGFIALIVLFVWWLYNSLVTAKARVQESWAQIDVQLKKRADLIPSLVETVRADKALVEEVYDKLTEARKAMQGAQDVKGAEDASRMYRDVVGRLFAIVESNPAISASQSFQDFRDKDTDLESKIAYARQFYNTNVMEYNIRIKTFPNVFLAGPLGFGPEAFFEAEETEREKPEVKF